MMISGFKWTGRHRQMDKQTSSASRSPLVDTACYHVFTGRFPFAVSTFCTYSNYIVTPNKKIKMTN